MQEKLGNPHLDDDLIVWKDEYGDRYKETGTPPSTHFDLQWKLALEKIDDYKRDPGANTEDEYIKDRVLEWTGVRPDGGDFMDASTATRKLDHPIPVELIRDKKCIDIGCGMGRWSKTMQMIGAESVLSVDISEHALKSVSAFNPNTLRADITKLTDEYPELVGQFDFANLWGVAMHTYNPKKTFMHAAKTVKGGGSLFIMIYAPEGMHGLKISNLRRKRFHSLKTVEERLAYADDVYNRKTDWSYYPIYNNLRMTVAKLLNRPKGGKVSNLDALEAWFNWVVPLETIASWIKEAGFESFVVANEHEKCKCAYHILARNKR